MPRSGDAGAGGEGTVEQRAGFPFAFACRRSGNCCAIPGGLVRVDAEEIAAIAAALGMTDAAFRARFLQLDGATLIDGPGHRCPFLVDGSTASCSIYPQRPRRCRQWPFWPELLHDRQLLHRFQRTCPGIVEVAPGREDAGADQRQQPPRAGASG